MQSLVLRLERAIRRSHPILAHVVLCGTFVFLLSLAPAGPALALPTISCPADIMVGNAAGMCGAFVHFTVTSSAPVVCTAPLGPGGSAVAVSSGSFFPVGSTLVTCTAADGTGTAMCQFRVIVSHAAPRITSISASPNVLWPPDHKFVPVTVSYSVSDSVPIMTCALTISSNEAVNATGSGHTAPDWEILDVGASTAHILLRAERAGPGDGRIYTITLTCMDACGFTSSPARTTVTVPHDQGKGNSSSAASTTVTGPPSQSNGKTSSPASSPATAPKDQGNGNGQGKGDHPDKGKK
jgi:hypothetical protein